MEGKKKGKRNASFLKNVPPIEDISLSSLLMFFFSLSSKYEITEWLKLQDASFLLKFRKEIKHFRKSLASSAVKTNTGLNVLRTISRQGKDEKSNLVESKKLGSSGIPKTKEKGFLKKRERKQTGGKKVSFRKESGKTSLTKHARVEDDQFDNFYDSDESEQDFVDSEFEKKEKGRKKMRKEKNDEEKDLESDLVLQELLSKPKKVGGLRNAGPTLIWELTDCYFAPIEREDLALLEPKNLKEDAAMQMPPLGPHYTRQWLEDDIREGRVVGNVLEVSLAEDRARRRGARSRLVAEGGPDPEPVEPSSKSSQPSILAPQDINCGFVTQRVLAAFLEPPTPSSAPSPRMPVPPTTLPPAAHHRSAGYPSAQEGCGYESSSDSDGQTVADGLTSRHEGRPPAPIKITHLDKSQAPPFAPPSSGAPTADCTVPRLLTLEDRIREECVRLGLLDSVEIDTVSREDSEICVELRHHQQLLKRQVERSNAMRGVLRTAILPHVAAQLQAPTPDSRREALPYYRKFRMLMKKRHRRKSKTRDRQLLPPAAPTPQQDPSLEPHRVLTLPRPTPTALPPPPPTKQQFAQFEADYLKAVDQVTASASGLMSPPRPTLHRSYPTASSSISHSDPPPSINPSRTSSHAEQLRHNSSVFANTSLSNPATPLSPPSSFVKNPCLVSSSSLSLSSPPPAVRQPQPSPYSEPPQPHTDLSFSFRSEHSALPTDPLRTPTHDRVWRAPAPAVAQQDVRTPSKPAKTETDVSNDEAIARALMGMDSPQGDPRAFTFHTYHPMDTGSRPRH